jgi:hypothetical protein
MSTHGATPTSKEYHVERLWREARPLNYISAQALNLPRAY